jgi:hypothetical protein
VKLGRYIFVVALVTAACDRGSESPTTPDDSPPQTVSLQGNWSGTLTDNGVENRATLQLTQDYNNFTKVYSVSGPISWTSSTGSATGTFTGSLTGTTLGYRIIIPVGGFTSPPSSRFCSASIGGVATGVTRTLISADYSGTQTCRGLTPFPGVLQFRR